MKFSNCGFIFLVLFVLLGCSELITKARMDKVENLKKEGDYGGALKEVNGILDKDSFSIEGLFLRAEIFSLMNNERKAIEDYRQILRVEKLNTLANFNIGVSYYLMDNYDSSILWINKAISFKGNDSVYIAFDKNNTSNNVLQYDVNMETMRYTRAKAYYYKNDLQNAINDFQFCLLNKYNVKEVYLFIGLILVTNNKKEDGCRYLNLALLNGNLEAKSHLDKYCMVTTP